MTFDFEMLLRLLLAAVLGGVIGAEREQSYRGAGLRTHALVATASALAIIVSAHGFGEVIAPGRIVLDPSRVAAQVITGIGFLGAGIIIFRKNAVRGLTTAASVWAVASVGLATGAGLYIIAIGATTILAFILIGIKKIEKTFFTQKHVHRLGIQLKSASVKTVSDKLKHDHLKIVGMNVQTAKEGESVLKVEAIAEEKVFAQLFQELQAVPGVEHVTYTGRFLSIGESASEDFEDDIDSNQQSA
jgi:putative Mg2+ transporter-C (MgtC) family protein